MEHPIYHLDRALVDYLGGELSKKAGASFARWQRAEEEAARLQAEETCRLGREAIARGKTGETLAQEDLVAGPMLYPPRNEAWTQMTQQLLGEPVWTTLLQLYSGALLELRDLDNMEAAIRLAEREGDKEHAARVREAMALDEITEPVWWMK